MMPKEKSNGNINYLRIVDVLRRLLNSGLITKSEYSKAKYYYRKMTGADIAVC